MRIALLSIFALLLVYAERPADSAVLELSTSSRMPARFYIRKNNANFRLQPTDALIPIRGDTFYRDPLWTRSADPKLLEVVAADQFHYLLLKGEASIVLPPGKYKIEAYRGLFYKPAFDEFELKPNETRKLELTLAPWPGADPGAWISADDHIHLTRTRAENHVYLGWLEAEDLTVGNFLQLQRQMDAAPQYAFGRAGEVKRRGYVIRPGHESRNEYWGHINILGPERLIRPLSTGLMYANTPESWPYPSLLFAEGRKAGGTVGYAHFFQKPQHSTIYMDAALGNIDFVEVFQFGVLKTDAWYELLNAGIRVTGIAGSDFPVNLGRMRPWPNWLPLLGPERAVVKGRPGENSWETWARGVREGRVMVSNGPIVELDLDPNTGAATASAAFYRSLEALEIVRNGEVIASSRGPRVETRVDQAESCWVAARVRAETFPGEPVIQAHTNPVYLLKDGKPVAVPSARRSLSAKWQEELAYYRGAGIDFGGAQRRREFFEQAERALSRLRP